MIGYQELRRLAKQMGRSVQARRFLLTRRSCRAAGAMLARVLCYHNVSATEAKSFCRQMQWLASGFEVVPIGEIVDIATGRMVATRPAVAISFDDGFRNNFDVAAPILRDLGLPATVFVVTSGRAADAMKRERAPDGPDDSWPSRIMMTWDEIHQLSEQGFDIALHAHRHRDQANLSTDDLRSDLATAAALIRQHTEKAPRSFAWPFGTPSNRHANLTDVLREIGIGCAFSGIPGNNMPGTDPYFLFRDAVDPRWPNHLIEALLLGMLDYKLAS